MLDKYKKLDYVVRMC